MGSLRTRMAEDLRLAGFSQNTRRIYLHYAKHFTKHFMRSPSEMGEEEIRTYLLHLLDERKLSHDTYRQCFAALKFLYEVTLNRSFEVASTLCANMDETPAPM
jgi:integrase/recombinase XerD